MDDYLSIGMLAAFVLAFAAVSGRLERTWLTGPIVFVTFGFLAGPSGVDLVALDVDSAVVKTLAEITLVLVLFTDSARIDLRALRHNLAMPLRLLGIGLPLTILAGVLAGHVLFPHASLWLVALAAAILAPTDAALGQAVVTNPAVPPRVRQALNVESGLNDGICVPVIAFLTAGAVASNDATRQLGPPGHWLVVAGAAIGWGVVVGAGVGLVAARLVDVAARADWMSSTYERLAMVSIPILVYALAQAMGGSGFIASFAAGLAVGSTTRSLEPQLFAFAEQAGELLGLLTWVVFGGTFVGPALAHVSPAPCLYALLSLTVVRMLPVAASLPGLGLRGDTAAFVGWFGPRGLASVVFAIGVVDDPGVAGREDLLRLVAWTILGSIFLHGLTALRGAEWYGRRCHGRAGLESDREMAPETEMRPRQATLRRPAAAGSG